MDRKEAIEIPFGAKDSELKGWEYTIPESMEAEIKDGKIIVREKESEDERIRKELISFLEEGKPYYCPNSAKRQGWAAWLEKQGEQNPVLPGFEEQERVAGRDYIPVEWVEAIENYGKWKIVRTDEQNPAWSEEDEHRITDTIYFLDTAKKRYASAVELDACISWLISLKERYTWKPSE